MARTEYNDAEFQKFSPNSTEWSSLEYQLQLATGTCTAVLKEAWKISKPHSSLKFEKKVASRDQLTVSSLIDKKSQQHETIESIVKDGFHFPSNGLVFSAGYMHMDKTQHFQDRDYEVLVCKIAVGKSMSMPIKSNAFNTKDKELDLSLTRADLDENFDSLCLQYEDETANQVYHYKYVVYEDEQVLPEFVQKFTFDSSRETNLKLPCCDGKGCNSNAVYYCVNDDAYLCASCNELYHSKEFRLIKDHDVCRIEDKPKDFGCCNFHEKTPKKFFCQNCRIPLCIYCKINGSHSEGDNAKHVQLKIEEAYKTAVSEAKECDATLDKHKANLRSYLKQIDDKISLVNQNAKEVENQIYTVLEQALETQQRHTQSKLNQLLADQIELRRRYDEIQWAECFLRYQLDVLDPHNYLTAWYKHSNFKIDAQNQRIIEIAKVKPDIYIKEAKVVITTDLATDNIKKRHEQSVLQKDDELFKNDIVSDQNAFSNMKSTNKNLDPIAFQSSKSVLKTPDNTSKVLGLSEGPTATLSKWKKRFQEGGYDTVSGKDTSGQDRTMLNTNDSFFHESHIRMERLKSRFDENYVTAFTSKVFSSSDILKKSMEKKLIYYSMPFDNHQCDTVLLYRSNDDDPLTPQKVFDLSESFPFPMLFLMQYKKNVRHF